MTRLRAVALPIFALMLSAACGGAAAPSIGSNSPTDQASPTTASTASASSEPSTEPTSTPTSTADETSGLTCISGETPNLDSGWKFVQGGGATFGLAYPDDWEDLSGEVDFTAASLLDGETFAELGLDADATIKADFVRSPVGAPNLSVFRFGTVESTATEILGREVARYGALSAVEQILDDSIEGCLGGTAAAGLAMEFRSGDGNVYYQQNLFVVRNDVLYTMQWLDLVDPSTELLAEILTTWDWTGS
jgi:hypothetical protein